MALYLLMPRWGFGYGETQTAVFCFLVFVQMSFVLPARKVNMPAQPNRWVVGAILVGIGAQLLALVYPDLGQFLSIHPLTTNSWLLMLAALGVSWLLAEGTAAGLRQRNRIEALHLKEERAGG